MFDVAQLPQLMSELLKYVGLAALAVTSGILILNGARDAFEFHVVDAPTNVPGQTEPTAVFKHADRHADAARKELLRLGDGLWWLILLYIVILASFLLYSAGLIALADLAAGRGPFAAMGKDPVEWAKATGRMLAGFDHWWFAELLAKSVAVFGGIAMTTSLAYMVRAIVLFKRGAVPISR